MPDMGDDRFRDTVIYLVGHGEEEVRDVLAGLGPHRHEPNGGLAMARECGLEALPPEACEVELRKGGSARLHLIPHVNAPLADLPVRKVIGAHHFVADLTLPYGRVLYDYLAR